MFGLLNNNPTESIAKQISKKRAESVAMQRSEDHQKYAEMMAELAALEDHMLAMRESGLA